MLVALLILAGCGRGGSVPVASIKVEKVTARDLRQIVNDAKGKVVLINVWATWCPPCREEFPDLVRLQRDYRARNAQVLLVSANDDSEMAELKQYVAERGVDFPIYLKAEKDQEFINGLDPQWSGALPATFIFDPTGKLRHFWEGAAPYRTFDERISELLK